MSKKLPVEPCPLCQRKADGDCSHVDCPRRKPETAQPPPGRWYTNGTVPMRRSGYDDGG